LSASCEGNLHRDRGILRFAHKLPRGILLFALQPEIARVGDGGLVSRYHATIDRLKVGDRWEQIDLINRFRPLRRVVFPADALGNRARGLERELRASGRHTKKHSSEKGVEATLGAAVIKRDVLPLIPVAPS